MKVGIATTTIHVPHALPLLLKNGGDVRAFVVADEKTPREAYEFCADIPNCEIYSPDRQKELGYACSSLLGWNTTSRRSIAILEALKHDCDVIVLWDDDNIPIATHTGAHKYYVSYCDQFRSVLAYPMSGLQVVGDPGSWFDVGDLLLPRTSHRGFPHDDVSITGLAPVIDAKVGVAAGISLGDPDVSAVTRIATRPMVHQVSEVLNAGIMVSPQVRTVFNSQNTAFLRELAPCFLMVPQFGRYEDIYASLIAQRVMRELNLHVHFGKPYTWQSRNQHDLLKDLAEEQWGAENILEFAAWLDTYQFEAGLPVLEMVHTMWATAGTFAPMQYGVATLGEAWCEDCASVME
jgi:hypothetical protein